MSSDMANEMANDVANKPAAANKVAVTTVLKSTVNARRRASTVPVKAARLGLLGRKVGMTRLFTDEGDSIPVTIIDVSNNRVVQVRSTEVDGYNAIQVTSGPVVKASRLNKPDAGHFSKLGVPAGQVLLEFPLDAEKATSYKSGDLLQPEALFALGQKVDVSGVSLGKGFMGTIKRHNFSSNRASHGNSKSHNVPGSISMAQDPGRVFPGKKMAGHQGAVSCTVQNLSVVRIDAERGLLWVRGAVPGHTNADVVVRPAVKGA